MTYDEAEEAMHKSKLVTQMPGVHDGYNFQDDEGFIYEIEYCMRQCGQMGSRV